MWRRLFGISLGGRNGRKLHLGLHEEVKSATGIPAAPPVIDTHGEEPSGPPLELRKCGTLPEAGRRRRAL